MKKRFLILLAFTLLVNLNNNSGFSKDIIVTEGMSIKDAVESSSAGDKIIIKQGVYYESGIVITKKIELAGEYYPVIDGGSHGEIITVRADGVVIKGLKIQNTGISGMKDNAAIKIENSSGCLIQSNKLANNYFGIYLAGSKKCTVLYNEIMSNAVTESFFQTGYIYGSVTVYE
jgi:nitrous oxidase accessory protein